MRKGLIILLSIVLTLITATIIFLAATPLGKSIWIEYIWKLEKVEENSYEKQKEVENTCRAMISSYKTDKNIYEQYKDSNVNEEKSWANNAKIRANQTANTYNNYILKNSYIFKDNVPADIYINLEIIS